MKKLILFRFAVAALLVAFGCYATIAQWHGSGLFFTSLPAIIMSRSEMTRPIPSRELLIFVCAILAFVILLISCRWLIPNPAAAKIEHVIRHPAFVLPMGLLFYWGLYRAYRREKAEAAGKF